MIWTFGFAEIKSYLSIVLDSKLNDYRFVWNEQVSTMAADAMAPYVSSHDIDHLGPVFSCTISILKSDKNANEKFIEWKVKILPRTRFSKKITPFQILNYWSIMLFDNNISDFH